MFTLLKRAFLRSSHELVYIRLGPLYAYFKLGCPFPCKAGAGGQSFPIHRCPTAAWLAPYGPAKDSLGRSNFPRKRENIIWTATAIAISVFLPEETNRLGGKCPVCGKKITIGVQHRAWELSDCPCGFMPDRAKPFENLVPLPELIAAAAGMSPTSKKIAQQYEAAPLASWGRNFTFCAKRRRRKLNGAPAVSLPKACAGCAKAK